MLPHRSDTSRGHLHPPTRPRLSLPPSASLFLSFSQMSVSGSPAAPPPGWFLPCDRLCRYFPGGACASSLSLPHPAITPSSQLPGPPRYSLLSSYGSKMQRPLSTRQIFSPPGATTFHPRSQRGAVVYTIFGTSDRAIENFCNGDVHWRSPLRSLGARERRRSREICPLAS